VCDGSDIFVPGIMQHVERAGIHSGDSIAVYPPVNLSPRHRDIMLEYCQRISSHLGLVGMMNVQFVIHEGEVFIIEVNPRASRTVPFISKVTGINVVSLATKVILGASLAQLGITSQLAKEPGLVAVKTPVFSFSKLAGVEVSLGPEMKSTGEAIGLARELAPALYKAFVGSGVILPAGGTVLLSVADRDKEELYPLATALAEKGIRLMATKGTGHYLTSRGLPISKYQDGVLGATASEALAAGEIDLVVNTVTLGKHPEREGFKVRALAIQYGIPCLTSLDTLGALLISLDGQTEPPEVFALGVIGLRSHSTI